jgi:glycosyltransferase involved in cell wall biosynthesis
LTELLGNTHSDLRCIHHGVSEKFFVTRQAVERDIDVAPLRLLFVGHLERRKNPVFLLKLAQALHGEVPFVLTIVGNGPELEHLLKTSADKSWAAAVEFASEVSDQDKLSFYSRADLFVFPSIQEGFGLVLCEAMAAGVPALAFQTSAMPEIVKPGTGFMVPINDVQAMADRVRVIATDRVLLSAMRIQAVSHARRNFQWKQKVREIFDALHDNFDLQKKTL